MIKAQWIMISATRSLIGSAWSATPLLQGSNTPGLLRGQPVRRSFRFMLKVGLASEARSTMTTSAKAEGRQRARERSSD